MSVAKSSSGDQRVAEVRPGQRVPRLSYRNSTTMDGATTLPRESTSTIRTNITAETFATTLTSPPLSDAASCGPRSPSSYKSMSSNLPPSPHSSDSTMPTSKKKGSSLFSFFSVKEPTQVAVEQFAEQLKRDNKYKPTEEYRRPPVIKVNKKWDGMPESLAKEQRLEKQKKEERELHQRKAHMQQWEKTKSKRLSLGSSTRPRSSSVGNTDSFFGMDLFGFEGNSSSTLGSGSSASKSLHPKSFLSSDGRPMFDSSAIIRAKSDTASLTSDSDFHRGPFSVREGSVKSSVSSNHPDMAFPLDDIPPPPAIPEEYRSEKGTRAPPTTLSTHSEKRLLPIVAEPLDEDDTKHSNAAADCIMASACPAPLNTSQITSSAAWGTAPEIPVQDTDTLEPTRPTSECVSTTAVDSPVNGSEVPTEIRTTASGFLAGEAEELRLSDHDVPPTSILKGKYPTSLPTPSQCSDARDTGIERHHSPTPTQGSRKFFKSGRLALLNKDKPEK